MEEGSVEFSNCRKLDADKGNITCDCPFFLKKYVCKNSLSLTVRLNLATVPLAAKDIIIGRKPKVGRPALAKRALLTQ